MQSNTKDSFYLLRDFKTIFAISVFLGRKIAKYPRFVIKSKLEQIALFFNPEIYKLLLKIPKAFALEDSLSTILTIDKKTIINYKVKTGLIYCYDRLTETWKLQQVILSGSYLYFYEAEQDTTPIAYFYIINATLQENPKVDQDGIHQFTVLT